MSALVSYNSSDDDEELQDAAPSTAGNVSAALIPPAVESPAEAEDATDALRDLQGPMMGPSRPSQSPPIEEEAAVRPSSPYTNLRLRMRDLTQPPTMVADIPPSPPSSPDATAELRIKRFLELKKQGVHFNEDLGKKTTFRNPSLLSTMMDRAGIDEKAQYATSLPKELWDPFNFPQWAYKEGLRKKQEELHDKEEQQKKALSATGLRKIDWVGGETAADLGKSDTPSDGPRGSTAERVMPGLNRDRMPSPMVNESSKRRRLAKEH